MYREAWYAAERLNNTYIIYKGKMYLVNGVSRDRGDYDFNLKLRHISGTEEDIQVPYKDINVTPIRIGFINCYKQVSFVTRMPLRNDWRQGLRMRQLITEFGHHHSDIPWKEFEKTLTRKFPTVGEVINNVKQGYVSSQAFHQDFAVKEDSLLYKSLGVVGYITNNGFKLLNNKQYLQEVLNNAEH